MSASSPTSAPIARVVLYTTPSCSLCSSTKRSMLKYGCPPQEVVDLSRDARAHAFVTGELGYTSVPVVVAYDGDGNPVEHWNQYRLDRIRALGARLAAQAGPVEQAA